MDVERLSTERTQRAQRLCAARVIEIADADAAAVARVVFGQCTAEPGCAAGDENALTLHPSLSFSSCADSLAYLPSSTRAIMPRCTASGPSARRSTRAVAYSAASGKSCDRPAAPWIWIASLTTCSSTFGATTLIAERSEEHTSELQSLMRNPY